MRSISTYQQYCPIFRRFGLWIEHPNEIEMTTRERRGVEARQVLNLASSAQSNPRIPLLISLYVSG